MIFLFSSFNLESGENCCLFSLAGD
jgi:hypothetical protein